MALPLTLESLVNAGWHEEDQNWTAAATPTWTFFKNKKQKMDGGLPLSIPILKLLIPSDNPAAKGPLSTAHFDTQTMLTALTTGHYHWPISVDLEEKMQTQDSPNAYAGMVAVKTRSANESYNITMNADLVNGVSFANFYSTRRLVGILQTLTGLGSTYFNIPASTTNFASLVNSTTTMAGSISEAFGDLVADSISRRGRPDYAACSAAVWKQLKREHSGRERVIVGEKGTTTAQFGIEAIMDSGVPIVLEPACASSSPYDLFAIDSRTWYFEYRTPSGKNFLYTTEERVPVDSYVGTVHKSCWPILRCGNPRVNFYFSGLTS